MKKNPFKENTAKVKVARVATVPFFFTHLLPTIKDLENNGFDVDLISGEEEFATYLRGMGFKVISFPIKRDISPLSDLLSILRLAIIFRKNRYQIVHSTTPKAGLISALAALIARVPVRMHTFTGQRWATLTGPKRLLLKLIDSLVVLISSECHADSLSQIQFLKAEGIANSSKIICLGQGSLGGIDFGVFSPDKFLNAKQELSREMDLDAAATWFLFVGRITRDKGIHELVSAFEKLSTEENAQLLIVGSFEEKLDPISPSTKNIILNHPRIKLLNFQKNPGRLMAAADVLCLPSYREGFGTVVIEAAASGTCAIGTHISGLKDAIVDGVTGLLVPPRDPEALRLAMKKLTQDRSLLEKMAYQASRRAREKFSSELISRLLVGRYRARLGHS